MTSIKDKFHFLSFSVNILHIIDGISSTVHRKGVVHATPSLSSDDVLFVPFS